MLGSSPTNIRQNNSVQERLKHPSYLAGERVGLVELVGGSGHVEKCQRFLTTVSKSALSVLDQDARRLTCVSSYRIQCKVKGFVTIVDEVIKEPIDSNITIASQYAGLLRTTPTPSRRARPNQLCAPVRVIG